MEGSGDGAHVGATATTPAGGEGIGDGDTVTRTGEVSPVNWSPAAHGDRAASATVEVTSAQRPDSAASSTGSSRMAAAESPVGFTEGVARTEMTSPRRQNRAEAPGRPAVGLIQATKASAAVAVAAVRVPDATAPMLAAVRDTGPPQRPSRAAHSVKATAPEPAEYADTVATSCCLPTP